MHIVLFNLIGLAAGTLIGWVLGKAAARLKWEKENVLLEHQFGELEKAFRSYRRTQAQRLHAVQQQLQEKESELAKEKEAQQSAK